jgi:hypothetical protein
LEEVPKSKFFAVYHTFRSTDAATAFWKMMTERTPEDLAKLNADWDAMGYHNHLFLPDGGDSAVCCIWETESDTTVADFKIFIDSTKGPGGGQTFINRVTHAAPGSQMPPSFFDHLGDSTVAKPTTGAFFWVDHTFKSPEKAAAFWGSINENKPGDMVRMNEEWDAMGFHNHLFCAEGGAGQTICLWESRSDLSKAEFQGFIDSEKGPGCGEVFNNEVHKVAPGGVVPSAFFAMAEEQVPLEEEKIAPEPTMSVQPEPTPSARDVHASGNPCLRYCVAAEAETEFVVHQ